MADSRRRGYGGNVTDRVPDSVRIITNGRS